MIAKDFKDIEKEFIDFRPHLVLLDIILPTYDGFYWCEKIRRLSKIPIIFISSKNTNMDIVIAINMSGDDFIVKPFSNNILVAKINALFRRSYSYINSQVYIIEHNDMILDLGNSPMNLKNTVIVEDEVFNDFYNMANSSDRTKLITIKGISVENYKNSKELTKRLSEIIPSNRGFSSFFRQFEEGMIRFGQLVFICLFLGMLFLMATRSIIYFKQLNDANENKYRYGILRKIGLSTNETRKIILKNLQVIFIAPFMLGLSHCLVALGVFSELLHFPIRNYVIFIISIYFIIYVFYFFLTFNSYSRIVIVNKQLR